MPCLTCSSQPSTHAPAHLSALPVLLVAAGLFALIAQSPWAGLAGLCMVVAHNVWAWRRLELWPIAANSLQTAARVGCLATLLAWLTVPFSMKQREVIPSIDHKSGLFGPSLGMRANSLPPWPAAPTTTSTSSSCPKTCCSSPASARTTRATSTASPVCTWA